ncbi:MAG TPA: zf-HC2 domain-containing protein [Gaiellaceae bacterium]|nr:zf-HC2 domain-containing protein [Gaiellaceae bacterium]
MRTGHCDRTRAWVSLQLDGCLSEFEGLLLERHLARCRACAAFARDLRAQTRLLRSAPREAPAAPVALPVRRRRLALPVSVASAAAAAAAAFVALHALPTNAHQRFVGGSRASALALVAPGDANLGVQRTAVPRSTGGLVRGQFGLPA